MDYRYGYILLPVPPHAHIRMFFDDVVFIWSVTEDPGLEVDFYRRGRYLGPIQKLRFTVIPCDEIEVKSHIEREAGVAFHIIRSRTHAQTHTYGGG